MREYIVKTNKLKKVYSSASQKIIALKEIDIEIKKGEFVTIMGSSGAGKTTFLNLIGCLDRPTSGKLDILGCDPTKFNEEKLSRIRVEKIGFVFEDFFLISFLNALENVQLPPFIFFFQK
ncbi:unnamed protein product [marine sediment metagenome]|uniref:ABC transporter domain-containing protein n=1 Tax=marine sediment metagenome TaxID=412755 RepID=X1LSQ4_9ZZZZ